MKYWITKTKEKVEIAMMTDKHIERTLKMLGYKVCYEGCDPVFRLRLEAVVAEADRRGLDFESWIIESDRLEDERDVVLSDRDLLGY